MNTKILAHKIISIVREVSGKNEAQLHSPSFNGNETSYIKDCLESTFVSSIGEYVTKFEQKLSSYTKTKNVIAVINGTSALHIALILANVRENDEVLLPSLTFIATANAIIYCKAQPHFVDIETETLGICPHKLREHLKNTTILTKEGCRNRTTGRIIRALIPVHIFGHPANIEELQKVANEFCLNLVEDAAEALGSFRDKQHIGTFGMLGILSFNGNKIITTGGGGAILTNDSELSRRAKHLTTTARIKHEFRYMHDEVGFNYRLPNINAALGCAQMEQLPKYIKAKRQLAEQYANKFEHIEELSFLEEPKNCKSNYWLNTILLEKPSAEDIDQIINICREVGIQLRPLWTPMHKLQIFKHFQKMNLTNTENYENKIINIPSSPNILNVKS